MQEHVGIVLSYSSRNSRMLTLADLTPSHRHQKRCQTFGMVPSPPRKFREIDFTFMALRRFPDSSPNTNTRRKEPMLARSARQTQHKGPLTPNTIPSAAIERRVAFFQCMPPSAADNRYSSGRIATGKPPNNRASHNTHTDDWQIGFGDDCIWHANEQANECTSRGWGHW